MRISNFTVNWMVAESLIILGTLIIVGSALFCSLHGFEIAVVGFIALIAGIGFIDMLIQDRRYRRLEEQARQKEVLWNRGL